MEGMSEQELRTLDGALNVESINSFSDILRVADSLKSYIFVHGVTTEKELGEFLVDSGYKGFPESVKPYLDYAAIGTEYYAERGGAFTAHGYTLRRSSAEPEITARLEVRDAAEYGRNALLELCGDQEVLDTIDGFMDWEGFGAHMMEADGIAFNEDGDISPSQDMQTM